MIEKILELMSIWRILKRRTRRSRSQCFANPKENNK